MMTTRRPHSDPGTFFGATWELIWICTGSHGGHKWFMTKESARLRQLGSVFAITGPKPTAA